MGIAKWRFVDLDACPQGFEAETLFSAARTDAHQRQHIARQHDAFMAATRRIAGPERPPQQPNIDGHERQDRPGAEGEEAQARYEEYAADRTDDPAVRQIAYDIVTAQASQSGAMYGLLEAWDLPQFSPQPAMTWTLLPTLDGSGNDHQMEADAAAMNRFIEAQILTMPAQYFWVHKRFKSRPEGAPPVYE